MLAARRVIWARVRSGGAAVVVGGARRHILPQPPSPLNKTTCTLHTGHLTAWQKASMVDDLQVKAGATIATLTPLHDQKMLQVRWEDGKEDTYPYIWLRDNCQCPNCFHPVSLARRIMLKELNLSVTCSSIKMINGGDQIEMEWTDGHVGTYNAHWLHERAFRGPQHEPRDRQCRLKQQFWGRELQENLPRASYTELLQDDRALLTFIENLEILGIVHVSGIPAEIDQIQTLTKRIGHLKTTHYGETFNVHNRLDPCNLAYTSDSLDMHTDLTYMAAKPGIQLLHCIKQFAGDGGDTIISDGVAGASKLRESNPKYFDTLSKTLIDFVDIEVDDGVKFHACWRAPVIELELDGSIKTINWHQMSRDSRFQVSSEAAAEWYAASLALRDILYHPDNLVKLKLQPGDLMVFDNLRVMHGRYGFRADEGERLLQGGYWEWDSVRSLRRVLRKEIPA